MWTKQDNSRYTCWKIRLNKQVLIQKYKLEKISNAKK